MKTDISSQQRRRDKQQTLADAVTFQHHTVRVGSEKLGRSTGLT